MREVILAIDDNVEFLSTLRDILEEKGYQVKTLSDPEMTELYVEKYHPDLMIIDVFMPERTGFNIVEDFCEKGLYEDIPKIFLTCLDNDAEKMAARARGVFEYMTKPFDPEELIETIRMCLQGQRQE